MAKINAKALTVPIAASEEAADPIKCATSSINANHAKPNWEATHYPATPPRLVHESSALSLSLCISLSFFFSIPLFLVLHPSYAFVH